MKRLRLPAGLNPDRDTDRGFAMRSRQKKTPLPVEGAGRIAACAAHLNCPRVTTDLTTGYPRVCGESLQGNRRAVPILENLLSCYKTAQRMSTVPDRPAWTFYLQLYIML